MADGSKQDLEDRPVEFVSKWNSTLNKSRREDRRSAIDLQTFVVHYPKSKTQNRTCTASLKIGSYPISIIPGQFCDFYREYTSTELSYLPLNTVTYSSVRHMETEDFDSQTDYDDSSSSDEWSEGTQITEDTLENTDTDMSLDRSSLVERSWDGNIPGDGGMKFDVAEASSQKNRKILW